MKAAWRQLWWRSQALRLGAHRINGWFDPDGYRAQVGILPSGLTPQLHYLRHGWREGRQPHPLFDAAFYNQQCLQAGIQPAQGAPLLDFLRRGWRAGLLPSPCFEPHWWMLHQRKLHRHRAPSLAEVHPLGASALQCSDHQEAVALKLLRRWQQEGIPATDLEAITQQGPELPALKAIPADHQLSLAAATTLHWGSHAWLQHLPVQSLQQLKHDWDAQNSHSKAPLSLLLLADMPEGGQLNVTDLLSWWHQARSAQQVVAINSQIGRLLQSMGVGATIELLQPACTTNGWLNGDDLITLASTELGLPAPEGLQEPLPVVLGEGGAGWSRSLSTHCYAVPGWEHLKLNHWQQARAQAAWLQRTQRLGRSLVLLNPAQPGPANAGLRALVPPQALEHGSWQPPLLLRGQFNESSLLEEMNWHAQGCPPPTLKPTPRPQQQTLWHHQLAQASAHPRVSVCISLHNYAHTIERALNSVQQQSLPLKGVELIVVDDGSSDAGANKVLGWLNTWGHAFHSSTLVQHRENAGLAAARNTAFQHATAAWCFVLDADNLLEDCALMCCLEVAERACDNTAVVHPLIALDRERGEQGRERVGLHTIALWQKARFLHGNHIDAMALVRHAAWQDVGGYQHIPGGWEDFDFWCCLIEAGWHGVSLPKLAAHYIAHDQSMLASQTNKNLRQLSRLLQYRHPWLELDLDGTEANHGAHSH